MSSIHLWSRDFSFWEKKADDLACSLVPAVKNTRAQAWLNVGLVHPSKVSPLAAAILRYVLESS